MEVQVTANRVDDNPVLAKMAEGLFLDLRYILLLLRKQTKYWI